MPFSWGTRSEPTRPAPNQAPSRKSCSTDPFLLTPSCSAIHPTGALISVPWWSLILSSKWFWTSHSRLMPETQCTGQAISTSVLAPPVSTKALVCFQVTNYYINPPHYPAGLFFFFFPIGRAYKHIDSLFWSISHFLLFLSCTLLYYTAYVFVPRNTIINSYVSGI